MSASSLAVPPIPTRKGMAGSGSVSTFMPGDDVLNPGMAGTSGAGSAMNLGGELWYQALQYLKVFGVVPEELEIKKLYDLVISLQDGTILCNLANTIKPKSCEVATDPQKHFEKMQNINSFLEAAKKFGVKDEDLFEADDLYYALDFGIVLGCISEVSLTKISQKAGGVPFPLEGTEAANVKDTVGMVGGKSPAKKAPPPVRSRRGSQFGQDGSSQTEIDKYKDLESEVAQAVSFQSGKSMRSLFNRKKSTRKTAAAMASLHLALESMVLPEILEDEDPYYKSGAATEQAARNSALASFADSEEAFVKTLHLLVNKFMRPMQANKQIGKGDSKIIFSIIPTLLSTHTVLLESVRAQLSSTSGRNLGKCFLENVDHLRLYGQFGCDLPQAIARIDALVGDKKTKGFMAETQAASGQAKTMHELLEVPLRHVLKYPIILKKIVDSTDSSHEDRPSLEQALAIVQDLETYIEEAKVNHESMVKMIASLKGYKGVSLTPLGPISKDDIVMYRDLSGKASGYKKLKLAYVFLLEGGAVLVTHQKGTQFKFDAFLTLEHGMSVTDYDVSLLGKKERSLKYSFVWALTNQTGEPMHVFATKSSLAKTKWMAEMRETIELDEDVPESSPRISTSANYADEGQVTTWINESPAKCNLVSDPNTWQAKQFAACQVPWIGGLSGSVLERLLFMKNFDVNTITDKVVLTLASALVVAGAHSLSEQLPVVKQLLVAIRGNDEPYFSQVPNPLDPQTGCEKITNKDTAEQEFIEKLSDIVGKVFSNSDNIAGDQD